MLKLRKITLAGLIGLVFLTGALSACSEKEAASPTRVYSLKGPTSIGLVKMMTDNEAAKSPKYSFTIVGTADEIVAAINTGECDIAAIPANLAATLYNKTGGGLRALAVNTLGVLYVVDGTGEVRSIADLKGKTVLSTGKGTTPEFAFNYILRQNGLDPEKDLAIEFKSEASEIGALLASGEAALAVLPEPYVTTVLAQNEGLRLALDLTAEWDAVQPEFSLVTGAAVAESGFAEKNKSAVSAFLKEYEASAAFVSENLDTAAEYVVKYGIIPKAEIARQAIPRCNITFISGERMKTALAGYLSVLFAAEPKSVGGAMPAEDFYYLK